MWIRYAGLLGYFALAAREDWRKRTVSVKPAVCFGLLAVCMQLWGPRLEMKSWLAGLLPGVALLGIGAATREAIGYGDALAMLVCGLFLGVWASMGVLMMGLFASCPAALFYLLWKKADVKTTMPFVPFLLAGYLLWLWGGAG